MVANPASDQPIDETAGVGIIIDPVARMRCDACGCEIDVSAFQPFDAIQCPQCGAEATVAGKLGPFRLLNLISTGGMGGVYHALDESLGRHVAIKVMLKSLGEDVEFVEVFKREAQAAARLNHPNVAQIYSFGQEKGQPYIVMELVSGKRFDKMIEDAGGKGLSQALVMQIGLDIAEGLKAADEISLIHGDIKPENILLDEKMQAKLVDFGIAQFQGQKQPGGVWGTPYYIAPEKLKGKKSDARSDIYNLGATLFHALAGRPPFEGATPLEVVKARLDQSAPDLQEIRPGINKTLADTIARMLEPEPAMRHPTYASLIGDMKRTLQEVAPRGGSAGARKVLIRKRPRAGVLTNASSGEAGETGFTGAGKIKIRATTHTPLAPPPPQKKSRGPRIALSVVLLFMLAGGVVFLGYHLKQKHAQEIEVRRQAYLLKTEIESVENAFADIRLAAANIVNLVPRVEPFVMRTHQAARAVMGDELDTYDLVPRQPPSEPVPEEKEAEPPAEDSGPERAVEAADSEPEAEPRAAEESEPGPPQEEPELVSLVRDVLTEAFTVKSCGEAADKVVLAAEEARETAVQQITAEAVAEKAGDFDTRVNSLNSLEADAKQALERAKITAERAEQIRDDIQKQRVEQERLAGLRQQEEERRQLVEKERARAENRDKELRTVVANGDYQDAIDTLKSELEGYQTEEGKRILQALQDRYTYLMELRSFLIDRLTADPYRWGWLRSASVTEDVLSADQEGVQLKGRRVPWKQVSIQQYIRFIEHYISDPKIRRGVRGKQYLATAIFCYENGGVDAAAAYVRKGLDLSPYLREEFERVLPVFPDL